MFVRPKKNDPRKMAIRTSVEIQQQDQGFMAIVKKKAREKVRQLGELFVQVSRPLQGPQRR